MRGDDVVTVAVSPILAEARLWGEALTEAGIRCQVVGDSLEGALNGIPGVNAEVWVQRQDQERAEKFLREYFAQEHDRTHSPADSR